MSKRTDDIRDLMASVEEVFEEFPEGQGQQEIQQHTLLEVWSSLLDNIDQVRTQKPSMRDVAYISGRFPEVKFADAGRYAEEYYDRLEQYRDILQAEIDSNPKALKNVEGDATENRHHYLNLLALWNGLAQRWENEWDYASPDAAIEFAAIVQANAFVLGEQGLVAHLASIDFEMTPEDGEAIQAAILGAQEG